MLKKSFFALTLLSLLAVGSQQLFADSPIRICNIVYRNDVNYCNTLPAAEQPACLATAEEMYWCCVNNPF